MQFDINDIQYKLRVTLTELIELPLDCPNIQRDLNIDNVGQIIHFQKKYFLEKSSFLFIGDLQVAIDIDTNILYLIDGQHRYSAIKELCEMMPDYFISINFIKISSINSIYPTLEDVFILLNKYTPIPRYILDCMETNNLHYREIIDNFKHFVKKYYKSYLSNAKVPRCPNISLDRMCDKIMDDSIIIFQYLSSGKELYDYMNFINKNIWVVKDTEKKGEKKGEMYSAYIQYHLTGNDDWTTSKELLTRFNEEYVASKITIENDTENIAKKNTPIPQKVRHDVWENFFGKDYNEHNCPICNLTLISIIKFEVGHIISVANGGDNNIENLKPICEKCNRSMGIKNMEEYKKKYY
jgi:hypothetical protein